MACFVSVLFEEKVNCVSPCYKCSHAIHHTC